MRVCEGCGSPMKKYQHFCSRCRKAMRANRKEVHKLTKELKNVRKDRSRKDPLLEYFKNKF